jgi:hypothetical protein
MPLYVYQYLIYLVSMTHLRVVKAYQCLLGGYVTHPTLICCMFKGIAVMSDGACAVSGMEASAGIALIRYTGRSLHSIWSGGIFKANQIEMQFAIHIRLRA